VADDEPVPEPIVELEPVPMPEEDVSVLEVLAKAGTERAAATTVVNNNFFIRPPLVCFFQLAMLVRLHHSSSDTRGQ
jgi:hypothetical protein